VELFVKISCQQKPARGSVVKASASYR